MAIPPMNSASWRRMVDRDRLIKTADGLAVALAVSLPWSTSGTSIFAGLLLIVLVPSLDLASLKRVLMNPAGGVPVLLWALGLIGTWWALDLPLKDRLNGLGSFHKLLFIPLLMAHFQRSQRGAWVMAGFLASCSILLVVSWGLLLVPQGLFWEGFGRGGVGIPVKDYIAQTAEFTVCIFLLAGMAVEAWRARRCGLATALLIVAGVFLANILSIYTSRTALVTIPVLLLLFAVKHLPRKGVVALVLCAVAIGAMAWTFSPHLRTSVVGLFNEVREFRPEGDRTRAGERLEFWRKSIGFITEAPLVGHGTGSIRDRFARASEGKAGMAGLAAANPHNQTFAVAVQLGLVGTAVLFAMWLAHLLLFARGGFVAWAGLVIVSQNIIGSLFNSHLFDFTHGWGYVVGVGVAAGIILQQPQIAPGNRAAESAP
jgi:O-antigen ligase